MSPSDLLHKSVRSEFMAMGYSDRDAGEVAAKAVRMWKRNTPHKDAIKKAIAEGKKLYKKRGRARK